VPAWRFRAPTRFLQLCQGFVQLRGSYIAQAPGPSPLDGGQDVKNLALQRRQRLLTKAWHVLGQTQNDNACVGVSVVVLAEMVVVVVRACVRVVVLWAVVRSLCMCTRL
jgi:hypothetical protein